ncbi:unnamed protein product [Cyprideis torosa]|uniref:Uncharacterized protein n=1 Tax=Cyprideis torosa TaxID=163714 RepID=A0A7R8WR65_9CRUS|nr:unnamed protein product [Cyprideis torosa]CAG0906727.1 unnamed protein product [Cyprideis torosa]
MWAMKASEKEKLPFHPCMNEKAHTRVARLHLPVAPRCNIHCIYCRRGKQSNSGLRGPGRFTAILNPQEALEKASSFLQHYGSNSIVGIAGPGDPLANEQTFATLELLRSHFREIRLCLCTNGLALPEHLAALSTMGLRHLTITINGVEPRYVSQLQPAITYKNSEYRGEQAAKILIAQQLRGLQRAASNGIFVKINFVAVHPINTTHITETARTVKKLGAGVFNIMPQLVLIQDEFQQRLPHHQLEHLQNDVWSCGGLAEAMIPANEAFMDQNGCAIAYTGAFAGALGKSLLSGGARTEVFAPRVLQLAQTLKAQGKMISYQPLCFTHYVLIVPKGNPAGIEHIEDMGKKGIKTLITPDASPPGGKASMVILQKAGVYEQAVKNSVSSGDCVQTSVPEIVHGRAHVAVVENRLTRLPQFKGKLDVLDIDEKYYPPAPIPFTIGRMKWAKNVELAEEYIRFMLSEKGQACFQNAGFIPALSERGQRLCRDLGIDDGQLPGQLVVLWDIPLPLRSAIPELWRMPCHPMSWPLTLAVELDCPSWLGSSFWQNILRLGLSGGSTQRNT